MNEIPAGMLEDQAMRAIDRMMDLDPTTVDLGFLLAMGLKIRALSTKVMQAQSEVAAE